MYHVSMADLPKNGSYQIRAQFPSPVSFCSSATTYLRARFSKTFLNYFCVELQITSCSHGSKNDLTTFRNKKKSIACASLEVGESFYTNMNGAHKHFPVWTSFSAYYKCFTKGG